MGKLVVWCVFAASCGTALPARAAGVAHPLAQALEVHGGACVNRESLVAQIEAWLGRDTIDRDLSVVVAVNARNARDVSFELRRGDELLSNRRFFPAPAECAPLEAVLALAIAMALEVSLRDELLVSLDRSAHRSERLQTSLAVVAEVGLGLLPGTSAGGAVRAGLRVHRLVALRFDGLVHTSQDEPLRGAPVALEFDAWLVGVRVATCLLIPLTRALAASTCGGLGAGSLRIVGDGYRGARTARLPWVELAAGAELSTALSQHWSIDIGASVDVPLGQNSYGLRYADGMVAASDTLPRVAATLRAGPAYYF